MDSTSQRDPTLVWQTTDIDSHPDEVFRGGLLGGALGLGLAILSGAGGGGRLLATSLGVVLGASAARQRWVLTWDPRGVSQARLAERTDAENEAS